jgi:NAD-dependent dihydropyrimidine dehydrogenase PreA subunit
MIANYGYEDGSGSYYITIDTNKCGVCKEKDCLKACPAGLFLVELDDWDDEVVVIRKDLCNTLRTQCAGCKPMDNRPKLLPCQQACAMQAIVHSW